MLANLVRPLLEVDEGDGVTYRLDWTVFAGEDKLGEQWLHPDGTSYPMGRRGALRWMIVSDALVEGRLCQALGDRFKPRFMVHVDNVRMALQARFWERQTEPGGSTQPALTESGAEPVGGGSDD